MKRGNYRIIPQKLTVVEEIFTVTNFNKPLRLIGTPEEI